MTSKFSVQALNEAADGAREVRERLGQVGDLADESTKRAAGLLSEKNFQLGPAMQKTAETWWFQVNRLYKSCVAMEEKLRATAKNDRKVEEENERILQQLTQYFQ